MNLGEVLKQKGLSEEEVSKEEAFRIGQATVLVWFSDLIGISVYNCSEKEIERVFGKTHL